jgi:hypothetical protein
VVGVPADQTEKTQQQVRRVCEDDCFPPIAIRIAKVLTVDGKYVVGFEFCPSSNGPHFAGHAYVRIGAESVKGSESKLNELIASRNTKTGRLLAAKDKHEIIMVIIPDRALIPGQLPFSQRREWECKVEDCDLTWSSSITSGPDAFGPCRWNSWYLVRTPIGTDCSSNTRALADHRSAFGATRSSSPQLQNSHHVAQVERNPE